MMHLHTAKEKSATSLLMKQMFSLLLSVALLTTWSAPAFAVAENVGPAGSPYASEAVGNAAGYMVLNGGAAWTLNVAAGSSVFTDNIAGPYNVSALDTNNANLTIANLLGSSTVYGIIGNTALFAQVNATGGVGTTVNFQGDVNTTAMGVGAGTVAFNSGTLTNVAAVTFTGDGTVNVAANTRVTGALTEAAGQTGTLNLYGAAAGVSQWTGAVGTAGMRSVNVVGTGITSQITGAVDTYAFDLGTNLLNISGNINLRGLTNSINTTLSSATVYGHIIEVGGATTFAAATGVNVTIPTGTYIPVGTNFYIVDSVAGPGTSIVTVTPVGGTNPLYSFTATPTLTGDLTIQITGVPMQAAPSPATAALVTLPQTPEVLAILTPLNALTDVNEIADANAQLDPSPSSLAAPFVAFEGARGFQNLWLSRLNECGTFGSPKDKNSENSPEKNSSCNEDRNQGWWIKGFGNWGSQDSRGGLTGYNAATLGTMVAYDVPIGKETRAGVGFGYANTGIHGKKFDARTDVNSYRGTLYMGHELGAWFINESFSFGWNEYDGKRRVAFTGVDKTAKADYDGQDYTGFLSAGYHFWGPKKIAITPIASLQYTNVHVGSYLEKGATSGVNLNADARNYNFFESGLGATVERAFTNRTGTYVPEGHFKWFHEFSNPRMEQTATFEAGGDPFVTQGVKASAETYNVGAGLKLLECNCGWRKFSVEAVYDFFWRSNGYKANQGTVRFTHRF
jgi:uncharacterized protein with beta-barrel porin domain